MQIPGGYESITTSQFTNIVWAVCEKLIDGHGLRVYFACLELTAIREAANRARKKQGEKPKNLALYRLMELERLTQLSAQDVRRALRHLQAMSLVSFSAGEVKHSEAPLPGAVELLEELACRRSPKRPIPVPRRMLRFLARNGSIALSKTIVAYILRGLSITSRTGEIQSKGTVKASWIADNLGLSLRSVKYAQAQLRQMGWISKDLNSHQCKLNRTGAYFVINLDWCPEGNVSRKNSEIQEAIVNRDKTKSEFALPPSQNAPCFARPKEDKKTSNEYNNQETRLGESLVHGISTKQKQNPVAKPLPPPNLSNVQPEDLKRFDRLCVLYQQAVARGWLAPSEAGALNFVAAAVRAREVGDRPGSLFITLVQKQLWQHITLTQEDHARRTLGRYRELCPMEFLYTPTISSVQMLVAGPNCRSSPPLAAKGAAG